jgi:hypothetical protein
VCSGSGNTRGGVLFKHRDQRRGRAEGVGDHSRPSFEADRGPQFASDLGDQYASVQWSLRIKRRESPQRELLIGVREPNREPEAAIKR